MLDSITGYFVTLSPGWLILALFASAYIENIFPPIPGDTVTVFAAYLVGRSQARLAEVFFATTAGSLAGFMTLYALGHWVGMEYFLRKDFKFLPAAQFKRAGEWFRRRGLWIVLLNRLFTGVRSAVSIAAGVYRLPWLKVLGLAGLGCAVWNGTLIWAGYKLGANWRVVERMLSNYHRFLLAVAIGLLLVWLLRRSLFAARKN